MSSSFKVKLESVADFMDIFESNKDFRFLMDCYYRALGATDFITKYYNAFTAIEFIENQFTKCIETTSLLEGCVLDQIIINIEDSDIIRNTNRERIVSRIKSALKNATLESRAEKLLNILTKV